MDPWFVCGTQSLSICMPVLSLALPTEWFFLPSSNQSKGKDPTFFPSYLSYTYFILTIAFIFCSVEEDETSSMERDAIFSTSFVTASETFFICCSPRFKNCIGGRFNNVNLDSCAAELISYKMYNGMK